MQNERRIELEDSPSGGFSLVIHHEDGGLDQVMLTKDEGAEIHQWLGERQLGKPPKKPVRSWSYADLEGMIESLHKRIAAITDSQDRFGTVRGALFRAAGHLSAACSDLIQMPLSQRLAIPANIDALDGAKSDESSIS